MRLRKMCLRGLTVIFVSTGLAACGGGGGGAEDSNPPRPTTFTIGGNVSGLAGSGLVLQNNGGDNLSVSADGGFTFSTSINRGGAYSVTIGTQPSNPEQLCTVSNGAGSANANVTNVSVDCVTVQYPVGGTVSGLAGSGLVLQNSGGDDLAITANGVFTFATEVDSGASYDVTVLTQPGGPEQVCTVGNGNGTIAAAVSDITITCVTVQYPVGGTVSGLAGSGLVLQNSGGDDLAITANGVFTFATEVDSGASYDVTVLTQPGGPEQVCTVGNGNGTASAAVSDITIICVTVQYSIGGDVSGLQGSGLVLQNNGGDDLAISADGAFEFVTPIDSGSTYDVTVLTQPTEPLQECTVTNAAGTVTGDVTNISITCVIPSFSVGGNVTGLAGATGLVLQINGGDDLAIAADGPFAFPTDLQAGSLYEVTVLTEPTATPARDCAVNDGIGQLGGAAVTDIVVICSPIIDLYVANDDVNAIALSEDGSTLYLGGDFTQVGPSTGAFVPIDLATGQVSADIYEIVGTVNTAVPDGAGGWYVGGFFGEFAGQDYLNLVHIRADGTVNPNWTPNPNAPVNSIVVSGSTVYVGGNFSSIGGQPIRRLAALDATTGQPAAWAPNPNNHVRKLVLSGSGSTLFVSGDFSALGGQTRNRIAEFDLATGNLTAWDPGIFGQPRVLAVSGNAVYIGGDWRLLTVDAVTGAPTGWDVGGAIGNVLEVVIDGNTVYAAGDFTEIGGQARAGLAAVDATTGVVTAWNPNPSGNVHGIAINGGTVYASGEFTTIGGQARNFVAAIDTTTGLATSWDPNPNDTGRSVAISGGTAFVGGSFSSVGGEMRDRLAAIDTATGVLTAWNPGADASVLALAVSGNTVYAGGDFTTVAGQPRNRIASIDAATGVANGWAPDADNSVFSIAVSGNTVYAAGAFTLAGGQIRNRLAAFDATSGLVSNWNPNADNWVRTIAIEDSTVYVGGDFRNVGGQPRNYIAALDTADGLATGWDPDANNYVYDIETAGDLIYVAGPFNPVSGGPSIGGEPRWRVAALDATTGLANSFSIFRPGVPYSLSLAGNTLYMGGTISEVNSVERNNVAAINVLTSTLTDWNPNVVDRVLSIIATDSVVYAAGWIFSVDGKGTSHIASIPR